MQNANPYQNDPLQIGKLIEAIEASALPEPKKLAYLYMIAEGSFSDVTLHRLLEDMKTVEQELKNKVESKKTALESVDQEIKDLEREIQELTPKAVKETQKNLDHFVSAVARQAEASQKAAAAEQATAIKTKMKFS